MNGLTVENLFAPFPGPDAQLEYEIVPADAVPQPYRRLLDHEYHMTVTVEEHHGGPVDVRILARREGDRYARKIVLAHQASGKIVMFGIVHINLDETSPEVRAAIVAGKTPLGRILIEHDVLRRIELVALVKIQPKPEQLAWFGLDRAEAIYGRLAIIHCDDRPAVELLEVVAPE